MKTLKSPRRQRVSPSSRACFEAEQVRRASLGLGLRTDSSARFEKALAPEDVTLAAHLFCVYLKELCPEASFDYALLDRWPAPPKERTISLRLSCAEQRLGLKIVVRQGLVDF